MRSRVRFIRSSSTRCRRAVTSTKFFWELRMPRRSAPGTKGQSSAKLWSGPLLGSCCRVLRSPQSMISLRLCFEVVWRDGGVDK